MDAQVVLISGASRGFGAAAARLIAGRGHTVVATMRNPARDAAAVTVGFEDGIYPARLDVTVPADIEAVVAATLSAHGRIDVLINNTGYGRGPTVPRPTPCDTLVPVACGQHDRLVRHALRGAITTSSQP
jgi:NAD(P)-dependent dehydrogenase (short-subunit alcohol dehydrogenase family)